MINYLVRRVAYALPILAMINLITFLLFFIVNSPDDIAKVQLGDKYVTEEVIDNWKKQNNYDLPLFYNSDQNTLSNQLQETLFFQKSLPLFWLDFGYTNQGWSINDDIRTRMMPSLAIALPTFILGLLTNIIFALLVVIFRATKVDLAIMTLAIILMSISGLFYIIGGQYLFAKIWLWFPISGYAPNLDFWKFIILPVTIGVISGIGGGLRWYRTLFLEEIQKDYIQVARSKGLDEKTILFKHLLKNAMVPILTGIVVIIPTLFMGSLLMEAFFAIPGLGSYTIEAIYSQDFTILRTMVFVGSALYVVGLILTDIAYALVDPRIRFN